MTGHPLESLSALLDGELAGDERRAVEAHVSSCPACARHLRELTEVDALARRLPPVEVPAGYTEALPARVRARMRAERRPVARTPWILPLAAGFLVAVLAPLVLREGRSKETLPARDDAASSTPGAATSDPATRGPAMPAPVVRAPLENAPAATTGIAPPARPQAQGYAAAPAREHPVPEAKARQDRERDAQPFGAAGGAPPPAAEGRAAERPTAEGPAAPPHAPAPAAGAASTRAEDKAKVAESRDGAANRADEIGRLAAADAAEAAAGSAPRQETAPSAMRKSAGVALSISAEERVFRAAAALPLSPPESARRARAAFARFVADHPRGARADEARARMVEASVAAFRASGDPADRKAAERDAEAYLSATGAPQTARVQAALRRLDEPR